MIANCSSLLIKDEKTREVLACATKAGSSTQALAGCAASSALPPDVARYASCAATSQGATSFALCAAGPLMNEEWRIAAECAVQSGGNPLGFAGCTAGRLTLKELTQCLSGGSCFGPNNTIVKFYETTFNDLLNGPGANNDIVVALGQIKELSGGPNSVINDPKQIFGGEGSVFNDPGQIATGAAKAASDLKKSTDKVADDIVANASKAADDIRRNADKAAEDAKNAAAKAAEDTKVAAAKAAEDARVAAAKAAEDLKNTAAKAAEDANNAAAKAARDVQDAANKAAEELKKLVPEIRCCKIF